jgi:hypothetical protein
VTTLVPGTDHTNPIYGPYIDIGGTKVRAMALTDGAGNVSTNGAARAVNLSGIPADGHTADLDVASFSTLISSGNTSTGAHAISSSGSAPHWPTPRPARTRRTDRHDH